MRTKRGSGTTAAGFLMFAGVAAAILAAGRTQANPLDTFGAGSVGIAMGGTGTAVAQSYEAVYYNPAALALMDRLEFGLGTSVYRPWLTARFNRLDETNQTLIPVSEKRFDRAQTYIDAGLAAPIPLGKGLERHLFAGVYVQSPADTLYSVKAIPGTEPTYPFYEDRNRRLSINAALAGRYKWFMIGAGVSILPTIKGSVRVDLNAAEPQNAIEVEAGFRLSPNIGILFEPIQGLTLGLSYRGAGETSIELPVDASVSRSINPIYLTVSGATFWTPHEMSFGIGWKRPAYTLAADVVYFMYSGFRMSSPAVSVYSDPERDNETDSSEVPDAGMRDSVSVRLGGEYRPIPALALRAGASWTQSPITTQSGESNLLGGDQWGGSFGIGFDADRLPGGRGPAISVNAHFMAAGIVDNTDAKSVVNKFNPGYPSFGGGGWFLNSGISVRFGFR